jgi:hypothetical protein
MPELNGEYSRTADFDAFLDKKRPVYKRTCSISADGGSSTMTVFCFHWHFSKMCSGWWLGPKFGSQEEVYGHCPTASSAPPVKGWQIRSHGRRQHDPARFTAGSVDAPAAMLPSVEEAIASLDVRTLMGSVRARSQGAAAYFAHFNCLLHLEYHWTTRQPYIRLNKIATVLARGYRWRADLMQGYAEIGWQSLVRSTSAQARGQHHLVRDRSFEGQSCRWFSGAQLLRATSGPFSVAATFFWGFCDS